MTGHKYIDRICIAGIILSVVLTLLFMNGEAIGLSKIVDTDVKASETAAVFTDNDLNGNWDTSSAVQIVMEGDKGSVSGNGAYFLDGNLVIASPGKYVISGTLDDGSIIVDFEQSAKVWILLDGVDISCMDDACFRVEEADKVFLTLAEGSENRMASGETYSEEALKDGTGGVIYSHDDLTINGSGTLAIEAGYKHGIESNDDLVITGGSISITCVQDGMHANDKLKITGASITVNAGDDAIHCETEIYIESGTILLENCSEGIEAPTITIDGGDITIYPTDDGINANGGESSIGFGGMGGFPNDIPSQDGTMQEAGSPQRADADVEESDIFPTITINGGTIMVINENGRDADGLDSNGDLIINGGTIFVSLNGSGGNNGLDYGSEYGGQCLINGGIVVACADSSMLEEISNASAQCTFTYVAEETIPAASTVTLADAEGSVILTREIPCSFSSLIISSPDLQLGQSYTLSIPANESETDTVTAGESETDTNTDTDTEIDAGTDRNTNTDTDIDTDIGTDSVEVTFDETVISLGASAGFMMTGMPGQGQRPDGENMTGIPGQGQGPGGENMGGGQRLNFGNMDENGTPAMPGQRPDTEDMSESQEPDFGSMDENGMPALPGQNTATAEKIENIGTENVESESIALDYDPAVWIWMLVCAAVLSVGIVFVRKQ